VDGIVLGFSEHVRHSASSLTTAVRLSCSRSRVHRVGVGPQSSATTNGPSPLQTRAAHHLDSTFPLDRKILSKDVLIGMHIGIRCVTCDAIITANSTERLDKHANLGPEFLRGQRAAALSSESARFRKKPIIADSDRFYDLRAGRGEETVRHFEVGVRCPDVKPRLP